ncbi:MAG: ATP-binding protein [Planctomycetota bacterium]|jgi:predicted AAA+ superfamily ATPase|nr:ATP-binding protein [Planctomycetota bacterium]
MNPRHIYAKLRDALSDTPAVLLRGARQTGKTTLAKSLCAEEGRNYLTFDSVSTLAAAKADPAGFVRELNKPVVIDEIQRVPEVFLPIKADIDENRNPGRYLLTGSANAMTLPGIADSLAGRMEVLTLFTLSQGEIAGEHDDFIAKMFEPEFNPPSLSVPVKTAKDIFSLMVMGGYPEIATRARPERRAAWFESYLTTLVERDARDLANIQDRGVLPRLFSLLAARGGTLHNAADLGRTLGLNGMTLARYTAILEAMFLVWFLPAWSVNLGKRLLKSPKVNLSDSGFACHLCGADEKRLSLDSALAGRLFESFVATEMRKQASWSDENVRLYHYRSQSGDEVDLVFENRSGQIAGMEIKLSNGVAPRDYKGLSRMRDALGDRFRRGVLIYTGSDILPLGEKLVALPIGALFLQRQGSV